MNNTFEFVGKLSIGKESDKFKPFEQKTTNGWTNTRLLFNVQAGDNRHLLEIKGLHKADETGKVFTLDKGGIDKDSGEKIKGQKLEVDWKDRFKPEIIEQVAEFKKFVIDVEEPKRRYTLEKATEKSKEGSLTNEELKELDVENVEKALEDSKKKRKDFIHETDFAIFVKKVIESGKFSNRLFRVLGNIEYSEYNGKFYRHLVPTRIYLAEKDAVPVSIGNIVLFFKKGAIEELDTKKIISGYVRNYDNQRKEDIPAPVSLMMDLSKDDEKQTKLHALLTSQFTVKDKTWKELGLKITMLNGSQKLEITEDMLNDFQKEMIELGCMTLDDIRAEMGGDIYGKPVEAMVIENVMRGYTKGRKDTLYEDSHFVIKPLELKVKENNSKEEDTDGDEDPFKDFM